MMTFVCKDILTYVQMSVANGIFVSNALWHAGSNNHKQSEGTLFHWINFAIKRLQFQLDLDINFDQLGKNFSLLFSEA